MFAVLDLETTGPDPAVDRIVQVGIVLADGPDLTPTDEWGTIINPGVPIPASSTAIHKITDAMVSVCGSFEDHAPTILEKLRGRILVGFGCLRFDVPCLCEEFARIGVEWVPERVIDVGAIFMELNPRTLTAAVKHYTGSDHAGAHDALADSQATLEVFRQQWRVDLPGKSIAELESISRRGKLFADPFGKLLLVDGKLCFGTRRNEGVPVAEDLGYARWMLRSDFPASTKKVLEAELERLDREAEAPEIVHPTLW